MPNEAIECCLRRNCAFEWCDSTVLVLSGGAVLSAPLAGGALVELFNSSTSSVFWATVQ